MKQSSYQKLKQQIKELEDTLFYRNVEIADAHLMCDQLDVPNTKSKSASVGHRLFWQSQGKRESFKTTENTEGYSPEEFKKCMEKLEALRIAPVVVEEKMSYKNNILKNKL